MCGHRQRLAACIVVGLIRHSPDLCRMSSSELVAGQYMGSRGLFQVPSPTFRRFGGLTEAGGVGHAVCGTQLVEWSSRAGVHMLLSPWVGHRFATQHRFATVGCVREWFCQRHSVRVCMPFVALSRRESRVLCMCFFPCLAVVYSTMGSGSCLLTRQSSI